MTLRLKQPIGSFGNGICQSLSTIRKNQFPVVEAIHKVAAYIKFFNKFRVSRRSNIHIAVIMLISIRIVLHCLLKSSGDAYIVDYQTAFLAFANTIHSGNGLHEVMTLHRFENVHSRQTWYVKARKPHINDNGNLQWIVIIFELPLHLLLMRATSAHVEPFLGILIRHGHHHTDFFFPFRA